MPASSHISTTAPTNWGQRGKARSHTTGVGVLNGGSPSNSDEGSSKNGNNRAELHDEVDVQRGSCSETKAVLSKQQPFIPLDP